jgi:hypothetical protein
MDRIIVAGVALVAIVMLAGGIFAGYVLGLIVSWLAWKGGRR